MTLYHHLAQSIALVHRLTTLATHFVRHIAIYRTGKHKCPDIATLRKAVAILQDDGIRGVASSCNTSLEVFLAPQLRGIFMQYLHENRKIRVTS